jgi:rubrerythrin
MDVKQLLAKVNDMPLAEIYAFAIEREQDAQAFYQTAREIVKDPGAQAMLGELYTEEVAHEKMLRAARETGKVELVGKSRGFVDLGMADYMVDLRLNAASSVQEVLTTAIKKEAFAEAFYRAAAEVTADTSAKKLFDRLTHEENQHKAMLETWYDDHILTTN